MIGPNKTHPHTHTSPHTNTHKEILHDMSLTYFCDSFDSFTRCDANFKCHQPADFSSGRSYQCYISAKINVDAAHNGSL